MTALLLIALLAPQVLTTLPGAQAVVAGDGAVLIEPDFLHLTGVDRDGKRRWRRVYQAEARGIQALFLHAGQVVLYAGERATRIDPRTGAPGPSREVPWLSSASQRGCWLNEVGGAYAFYCACHFQFAALDGATVGAPYRFHERCERDLDGSGQCGCWGSSGDLIGRAGDRLLARVEAPPTPAERGHKRVTYGEILVAVSATTGAELWRHPVALRPATYVNGLGVMPDGQTFWTADATGQIGAYDAATGVLRWQDPGPVDPEVQRPHQPESRVLVVPPNGLFFFANGQATLFDATTGQVRWRRPAPRMVLPEGALTAPFDLPGPGDLPMLRAADGAVAATLNLGAPTTLLQPAEAGRFYLYGGTEVRLHGPDGALIAQAPAPAGATLTVGDHLLVAAGSETVAFFDAATLAPLGTLAGHYQVVGTLAGRVFLAVDKDNQIKVVQVP